MCEKCVEIDLKIDFYRTLDLGPHDELARHSIKILIEDLEANKVRLHPRRYPSPTTRKPPG